MRTSFTVRLSHATVTRDATTANILATTTTTPSAISVAVHANPSPFRLHVSFVPISLPWAALSFAATVRFTFRLSHDCLRFRGLFHSSACHPCASGPTMTTHTHTSCIPCFGHPTISSLISFTRASTISPTLCLHHHSSCRRSLSPLAFAPSSENVVTNVGMQACDVHFDCRSLNNWLHHDVM